MPNAELRLLEKHTILEWGYSNKVLDLIEHMYKVDHE